MLDNVPLALKVDIEGTQKALYTYKLDRNTLRDSGFQAHSIDRLLRSLFSYSLGFYHLQK